MDLTRDASRHPLRSQINITALRIASPDNRSNAATPDDTTRAEADDAQEAPPTSEVDLHAVTAGELAEVQRILINRRAMYEANVHRFASWMYAMHMQHNQAMFQLQRETNLYLAREATLQQWLYTNPRM